MITTIHQLLGKPSFQLPPKTAGYSTHSTGLPRLDAQLPHGGWPVGAVTELRPTHEEIGAFSVLVPTLVRLTQAGCKVVLMASEQMPDLEALGEQGVRLRQVTVLRAADENALWAMEQKLQSGQISMLVAWTDQISDRQLRRLKAAAEAGQAMAMLFRKASARHFSSADALRLVLRPGPDGLLDIEIVRARGEHAGHAIAQGTRHAPRSFRQAPPSWAPACASMA